MTKFQIVEVEKHENPGAEDFVVSLIDDPHEGETKLVVMFRTSGHCAVLSFDKLVQREDISFSGGSSLAFLYEEKLRAELGETW